MVHSGLGVFGIKRVWGMQESTVEPLRAKDIRLFAILELGIRVYTQRLQNHLIKEYALRYNKNTRGLRYFP